MRAPMTICLLAIAVPAFGGALPPPPGPVTPTMKTLDEVNPSTPINAAGFIISAPGAYHFTQNLEVLFCGGAGIEITSSNVDLDLRGFTLSHSFACADGIVLTGPLEHVTIRNGHVLGFLVGIGAASGRGTHIDNVTVTDCTTDGIAVGALSVLHRVASERNAYGFRLTSSGHVVVDCLANDNIGAGFEVEGATTLTRCIAVANGLDGFTVATGPSAAPGASLTDCIARLNSQRGFVCGPNTTLQHCLALRNDGNGFDVGAGCALTGCIAVEHVAATGFILRDGTTMTACTARSNGVNGIDATGTHAVIRDCIAGSNIGIGINALAGTVITGCACNDNTVSGIEVFGGSVVSDCSTTGNGAFGIVADDSLVRGCASVGNGGQYGFSPTVTNIENH